MKSIAKTTSRVIFKPINAATGHTAFSRYQAPDSGCPPMDHNKHSFIVIYLDMLNRIERDKRTVSLMIRLYCRRQEGNRTLCSQCRELEEYAHRRLSSCRYGEQKTSCKACPTHCYRKDMREKIRTVMRFSGPRMVIYHPIAAIRHLLEK